MKANDYRVLMHAIDDGCSYGVQRYYKHKDTCPSEVELQNMAEVIAEYVLHSVCEWFVLEEISK